MSTVKRHYVYELREKTDKGSDVFYVGKGVGQRIGDHAKEVKKSLEKNNNLDSEKKERIAQLLDKNTAGELDELIIGRFDTDEEAAAVESTLIKWVYGRDNLTNKNHGSGEVYIRTINDFDSDNQLDDSRTRMQQFEQNAEKRGLEEAGKELCNQLGSFGFSNTTEPKFIRGNQDYTSNWPVDGTGFYIEFKLSNSRDAVNINARSNNESREDFVRLAEAAGYRLLNREKEVYAPLAEYKRKEREALDRIEGEACRYSSYLRGVPRSKVNDIVKLVQDFRIRIYLAEITLLLRDSNSNSISEVSSLAKGAIDVFKQRPEEKHPDKDWDKNKGYV